MRNPIEPDPEVTRVLRRALVTIGMECADQHTEMTPHRLARYLSYWMRPPDDAPFTVFDNEMKIDGLVLIGPISFWSCCSHHLLPFFGKAYFGYIPIEKIVGLSMVPMFVKSICARPWMQEEMTEALATLLWDPLQPKGLALVTRAQHTCQMLDLGPDVPELQYSVMRGVLRSTPLLEFLRLFEEDR